MFFLDSARLKEAPLDGSCIAVEASQIGSTRCGALSYCLSCVSGERTT